MTIFFNCALKILIICLLLTSILTPTWASSNHAWSYFDTQQTEWVSTNSTSTASMSSMRFGDFDGDGRTDVFTIRYNNQWHVNYNKGSGWTGWQDTKYRSTVSINSMRFGDFNGDGRTDVFTIRYNQWHVNYNKGSGWTGWQDTKNRSTASINSMRFGDFNGDGRTDVFTVRLDNQWHISYNKGNANWTPWIDTKNRSTVSINSMRFGDFNGDGRTDVFTVRLDNQWHIRYNKGNANWTPWTDTKKRSTVNVHSLRFGDFNGDIKTDIFTVRQGQWLISYNYGENWSEWKLIKKSHLQISDIILPDGNSYAPSKHRQLGKTYFDFTGDGYTDIFTNRTVYIPQPDNSEAPTAHCEYEVSNSFLGINKTLATNIRLPEQVRMEGRRQDSAVWWKLIPSKDGTFMLLNSSTVRALDIDIRNPTSPIMSAIKGGRTQQWILTALDQGYYRLTNKFLGPKYSLDTFSGTENNPFMSLSSRPTTGQRWKFTRPFTSPCEPLPAKNSFAVLTYNTMLLHPIAGRFLSQRLRAREIPDAIAKNGQWDVIVLNEAFMNNPRRDLIEGLKEKGYRYSTKVVNNDFNFEDGGVYIQSRWPILSEDMIVFDDCMGFDCRSNKGAIYARINKNGKIYNVFGTHLQSERGRDQKKVRANQLSQLERFIRSIKTINTATEPVIIAGDFNIDDKLDNQEYREMLLTLKAYFLGTRSSGHTLDTLQNDLAKLRYRNEPKGWLDYILLSDDSFSPRTVRYSVEKIKAENPFEAKLEDGSYVRTLDLSDHYGFSAVYNFSDF